MASFKTTVAYVFLFTLAGCYLLLIALADITVVTSKFAAVGRCTMSPIPLIHAIEIDSTAQKSVEQCRYGPGVFDEHPQQQSEFPASVHGYIDIHLEAAASGLTTAHPRQCEPPMIRGHGNLVCPDTPVPSLMTRRHLVERPGRGRSLYPYDEYQAVVELCVGDGLSEGTELPTNALSVVTLGDVFHASVILGPAGSEKTNADLTWSIMTCTIRRPAGTRVLVAASEAASWLLTALTALHAQKSPQRAGKRMVTLAIMMLIVILRVYWLGAPASFLLIDYFATIPQLTLLGLALYQRWMSYP